MSQANQSLRKETAGAGFKLWQLADKLGYTDSYFSRLLRKELSEDMAMRAKQALTELKEVK